MTDDKISGTKPGWGGLDQPGPCRDCGAPRQKGLVGIVTDRCLGCARAHQRLPTTGAAASEEASAEDVLRPTAQGSDARVERPSDDSAAASSDVALKPSVQGSEPKESDVDRPSESVQSETEEVTGGDKMMAGGIAGPEATTSGRKKRVPPSAAKNPDGVKLTPACGPCRKSKIRCKHRRVIGTDGSAASNDVVSSSRKRKREVDVQTAVQAGDDKDDAGDDSDVALQVGAEAEAPPPLKKKSHRVRWSDNIGGGKLVVTNNGEPLSDPRPAEPTRVTASSGQPQGRALRKRKFAEAEEGEDQDQEHIRPSQPATVKFAVPAVVSPPSPAAGSGEKENTGATGETSQSPRKRARRGRKPNAAKRVDPRAASAAESSTAPDATTTTATTVISSSGITATTTAAATAFIGPTPSPGPHHGLISLLPFPRDNLEGAAQLAAHAVLSRELQQRLEDCEAKWLAAVQSLQAAKHVLDNWLELFRTGQ